MMHRLQRHLEQRREGLRGGIYSVCSAHPYTLRAAAEKAVGSADKLFANLQNCIPVTMLSQFFPIRRDRLRKGQIANQPLALVIDRIRDTLSEYAVGCMLVDGHR